MGADENVAVMRRAYNAFNTGDMDTLTELMDETVWHLPGHSSMAGDYEGRGATLAYFGQLAQQTVKTAWSASSAALQTETGSTWTFLTASSSSSRTAG